MAVRAKFVVKEITRTKYGPGEMDKIVLEPVTADMDASEEDRKFWAATPYGRVELGCMNSEAARQFELGASYYLDFTPAF